MKYTRETIYSGEIPGHTEQADVARCECGCQAFIIFQIVGQTHPHFQCALCNKSYCSEGENCTIGASKSN